MKFYSKLLIVLILILYSLVYSQEVPKGELIETTIGAPSLKNNILGIPTEQPIAIYLPPSYHESNKSYPVVYFLPGFSSPIVYFTRYGVFQGFTVGAALDQLINDNKIKEMIFVIPCGQTFMLGSFYVNSLVSGNWEDFIVQDVVGYIDANYRTNRNKNSRAITGHSMGGFGAIHIGMRNPDIFCSVYSLAPGLFDPKGLENHPMVTNEDNRENFLKNEEEWYHLNKTEALLELYKFMGQLIGAAMDNQKIFLYAYGAAFSPDTNKNVPYIDYPYEKKNGELIINKQSWENFENGFGGWKHKLELYKENFKKLTSITIDVGKDDSYSWIPDGCKYLSELFNENNITHQLNIHEGGHSDKVRERIELYMLPHLSKILE